MDLACYRVFFAFTDATKWHSTYYEERLQTVNILIIRMFV